MIFIRIRE